MIEPGPLTIRRIQQRHRMYRLMILAATAAAVLALYYRGRM